MNVAVLASPEDGRTLIEVLRTLSEVEVTSFGLKVREGWQDLPQSEIIDRLQKADRYLVILSEASLAASWLAFAAGFGLGRRLGVALYRAGSAIELPRYLTGLPVIGDRTALQAFYRSEKAEWIVRDQWRSARAALLEMGISCHADSLAQCVRDGDTRAVELFLDAGFPPDSRDKHGVTLLGLAARSKHLAVAELLLERGAALDTQSEDRGYSPLMDAVLSGSAELVELFLNKGADPDVQSKDGQTALVVAVGRGDIDTAQRLLDYGADPDLPDKLGFSARRYAALFKVPAMAELFDVDIESPACAPPPPAAPAPDGRPPRPERRRAVPPGPSGEGEGAD